MPLMVARPMAMRRAKKIARRMLNGNLRRVGSFLLLEVPRSITATTAPGSIGCVFYEASLKEVLRLLIGSIGSVEHVRCANRNEGTCEWRADWRAFDRSVSAEDVE
jgi:hypothetical protein